MRLLRGIVRLPRPLLAIALVTLAILATTKLVHGGERTVTAYFTQTKNLYVGDSVQVLGVSVGKVTEIEPEPGRVRVEMVYDDDVDIPADAKAVIIAPSLVSVRHVALAPVYEDGPALGDGDVIPISRTAVPVEWDDMKEQLVRLSQALGPRGANADGSLGSLLETSAANLQGQGDDLNQTVRLMSEAMATLADGRDDMFATVRNLQVFVDALAASDTQVYEFNQRLASVSDLLADDRDELRTALAGLNHTFTDVQGFLRSNRATLSGTVADLQPIARMLARNRQKLADILQIMPGALSNFTNVYDPIASALTGALAPANLQTPAMFVCSTIYSLGGTPQECQRALGPLADLLKVDPPPFGLSPIERNPRSSQEGGPSRAADSASPDSPPLGLMGLLLPGGSR